MFPVADLAGRCEGSALLNGCPMQTYAELVDGLGMAVRTIDGLQIVGMGQVVDINVGMARGAPYGRVRGAGITGVIDVQGDLSPADRLG